MKPSVINQKEKTLSDKKYTSAIVSEVELGNGTVTQVVLVFNNYEVDFEEMNIGLTYAFSRCTNIRKSKNILYSLREGILKPFAAFMEYVWTL